MKLSDRNWKEFYLSELNFQIINSKAYHKTNLTETHKGLAYITRTNFNNGYDCSVKNTNNLKINPSNTIVFGAENATFFYQPFQYITGNKMYYISHPKFNKFNCLFLVTVLNKSIQKCGFGFGQGLTATRLKNRAIYLPITPDFQPDYTYMENYMKYLEQKKLLEYLEYIEKSERV